jgi:hypothetical protein
MSIWTLLCIATCCGMYKLGAYNARCPGEAWRLLRENSARVWAWMQTH